MTMVNYYIEQGDGTVEEAGIIDKSVWEWKITTLQPGETLHEEFPPEPFANPLFDWSNNGVITPFTPAELALKLAGPPGLGWKWRAQNGFPGWVDYRTLATAKMDKRIKLAIERQRRIDLPLMIDGTEIDTESGKKQLLIIEAGWTGPFPDATWLQWRDIYRVDRFFANAAALRAWAQLGVEAVATRSVQVERWFEGIDDQIEAALTTAQVDAITW